MRSGHLACALLVISTLAGCDDKKPPPLPPRLVLSAVVVPRDETVYHFTGTIESRYSVKLGFRVSGRLVSRDVEVGDTVGKGEQVASIDPLSLEIAVQIAIADVSSARAQLVNAAGAEQRQRILAGRNVVPQAQLESAQQTQQTSSASVRRAEANLAQASDKLTYAKLRSDMEGVVTAVDAQVGQVVQPGQSVVTVARPDIREAAVDVPEGVANAIKPGTPFEVALEIVPGVKAEGRVREIGPQADASTRTRRVKITLPGNTDAFRLGATIVATLNVPEKPTIELPITAVLERDGKDLVWVVDSKTETVSTRQIEVAGHDTGKVQVSRGLDKDERVVLAGVHSLEQGQKVRLATGVSPP